MGGTGGHHAECSQPEVRGTNSKRQDSLSHLPCFLFPCLPTLDRVVITLRNQLYSSYKRMLKNKHSRQINGEVHKNL